MVHDASHGNFLHYIVICMISEFYIFSTTHSLSYESKKHSIFFEPDAKVILRGFFVTPIFYEDPCFYLFLRTNIKGFEASMLATL